MTAPVSLVSILENANTQHSNQPAEAISLYQLILNSSLNDEETIKVKEQAILQLGKLYKNLKNANELAQLLSQAQGFLASIPKAKTAKIVRTLIDYFSEIPGCLPLQVEICQQVIAWAHTEKRIFLKQALETRLVAMYLENKMFSEALLLIAQLLKELKRLDDKMALVDVQLLESRVYHAIRNIPKAKASLTSAKASANSIYCPPLLQASLDMQSGILHAEENDFKTAYSYFFETVEGYSNHDDPQAVVALKYMLLCKIMLNQPEDVHALIHSKLASKYTASPAMDAIKAVATALQHRSLLEFEHCLKTYPDQLNLDPIIRLHLASLYNTLLEQNILKVIEPFSKVELNHVAQLVKLPLHQVEQKLSQLILDGKINGILDQGACALIIFEEVKTDETYTHALETIKKMGAVVESLYQKKKKIIIILSSLKLRYGTSILKMIEQQQQTPHLSSHLQNAWPNPTHYPTPMHSSSSLSLKIEHRDPHHPRDPNIQAQLNLNRECFLGTWFYTPCDCLFPSLEQHVNGLVHVAVPNYYFHETNNKNLQQNAIWGSEIYTDDSDIIAMLLHSGHLQLPKKTAFPYDVLVILRVYPKLAYYPSTSFNGITSRAWTDHHGVSLLIESAEFIPPGSSVRKAGRKLRKKLLADRLKLYQYEVKRKKRLSHLDDATFVYDISGTKRLVYTPQLGPFLEHQSFVLEPKLNDQHRTFSISPINSNDNTYTLTQEHHGQTWTIIKEFHWSHLTFHTQGVLITAPTSSFYSLPDPLPMSHGVLVPPPSPSPSSTTSTGLTTTTTASTVTTTTTTTTSETMTPTLSSGSFPSSSLSLASGLRDAKKTIVIHVAWVWLASTFRNTS